MQVDKVPGLRMNGMRLFRARYPNVVSMISADVRVAGSAAQWLAPTQMPSPTYYKANTTRNGTADGEFSMYVQQYTWRCDVACVLPLNLVTKSNTTTGCTSYTTGSGGACSIFEPSESYWCAEQPEGGGAFTFRVPSGCSANASVLPNLPYSNAAQASFNVYRPAR